MIFLTGGSGFLGETIINELRRVNKPFQQISRDNKSNNYFDFQSGASELSEYIKNAETIIHVAGRAHVSAKTDQERALFFKVNAIGTQLFLNKLSGLNAIPKKFIFISSVSVYGRSEGAELDENTSLEAKDAYGMSKIEAEKNVLDWCRENRVEPYILRLPLIVGNNAPANLGAMVKGIKSGKYASIGEAKARKSMVLASDVAKFILNLEGPSGIYNLTDGYHPSFKELETKISTDLKVKAPIKIPLFVAKMLALMGDIIGPKFPINSNKLNKLNATLTFSDKKARELLMWKSNSVLETWEIKLK
jgi:nucleoside-diphosphate-sugar epimerase